MKPICINSKYGIMAPDYLQAWDALTDWETRRFESMEENLKQGMTLLDIGTEHAWQSVIYAGFVGAENMCLFEPSPLMWPTIRLCWQANGLANPLRASQIFASIKTVRPKGVKASPIINGFPECAWSADKEDKGFHYKYISQHSDDIQQISLSDWCREEDIIPDAITVDVEGAEGLVVSGAMEILNKHKPLLWLAVHPDQMEAYCVSERSMYLMLFDCGYRAEFLDKDHEYHIFFRHENDSRLQTEIG